MNIALVMLTLLVVGASAAHAQPTAPSAAPAAQAEPPTRPPPATPPSQQAPASPPQEGPASPPQEAPATPPQAAPLPALVPPYEPPSGQPVPGAAVQYRLPPMYAPRPRPPRRHGDAGAPFALGIGAGLSWPSEQLPPILATRRESVGLDLFASYDVWTPLRRTIVAAGASLRSETRGDDRDLSLAHHTVQADLLTRYGATRWLWPHVRLGLGVVTTRFRMDELRGDTLTYADRDTHVAGTLGGGVTLRTPSRLFETYGGALASLALGVLIEGGYSAAPSAKLRAKPTSGSDIERATFMLGTLERRGPYLRILAVIRF